MANRKSILFVALSIQPQIASSSPTEHRLMTSIRCTVEAVNCRGRKNTSCEQAHRSSPLPKSLGFAKLFNSSRPQVPHLDLDFLT